MNTVPTQGYKPDWLDFETDCGFDGCRAMTHQVNHSFCRKHQKYFDMKRKERREKKVTGS